MQVSKETSTIRSLFQGMNPLEIRQNLEVVNFQGAELFQNFNGDIL